MSVYVIIRGPLGAGKSTIARRLQDRMPESVIFSVDDILEEFGLTSDREDGYISQKSFLKVNEIVSLEAKKLLNLHKPVIFDGNFYWESQIEDLVQRLDFPHEVFTLKVPLELCIQRDAERIGSHGKDAAMVVFGKATTFTYGKEIDATKPVELSVDEIISLLPVVD